MPIMWHIAMKRYHRFDITYQDNNGASSSKDSSQFQAMLAATLEHQDSWFFDTEPPPYPFCLDPLPCATIFRC